MTTAALYALGILILVVGLALSVGLHEFGHLIPAKLFGVKVTQWMIGFGPTVLSRRRGETEYGLKAFPLGGYIRMIGMYPPLAHREGAPRTGIRGWTDRISDEVKSYDEEIGPEEAGRTFIQLPVAKRIIVMLGGPTVNLLLSVLFIAILLVGIGSPQLGNRIASIPDCVQPTPTADGSCRADDPRSPAGEAGLRAGDRIMEIDGMPTQDWNAILAALATARAGSPVEVTYERDGRSATVDVTPVEVTRATTSADTGTAGTERAVVIGIQGGYEYVRQGPGAVAEATWENFSGTARTVVALPVHLFDVARTTFVTHEDRDVNGPVSIVGAGRLAGEITSADTSGDGGVREKAALLLSVLSSLNMALFVFNLIPLLPLDGGHVAGALIEAVRRALARRRGRTDPGAFDMTRLLPLTYAVVAAFLIMTVVLVYADIVVPVRLSGT